MAVSGVSGVANPTVSIVMLCYNHEKFVAEALDGVFAQNYSPLDIVIIDDFSQDRTTHIVAQKLSKMPAHRNLRFIRNPRNLGLLGTCEIAIAATRGEFIVITCDDDIMLPNLVTEMVAKWKSANVSLVATNAELIDENSQSRGMTFRDLKVPADDSFETLARDGSNACCFGASFGFEREVYATFGLPPAHLDNLDILMPFFAYLLKGAVFLNKPLLKYRVHGQNNSLSLIADRSDAVGKLKTNERIYDGHIALAIEMEAALDRFQYTNPSRYAELQPRIGPLITIQVVEMAKKLVRTRIDLQKLRDRVPDPKIMQ